MAGRPPDELLAETSHPVLAIGGDEWLDELPRIVDELLTTWDLTPAGPARTGYCAVVLPVVGNEGGDAVLKLSWPHAEAVTEHLALGAWGGNGAVRLIRADPRRFALLLDRLDFADLTDVFIDQACEIIGDRLADLDLAGHPKIPRLLDQVPRWQAKLAGAPMLPPRIADQASHLLDELTRDDTRESLLHTDLHYGNVLARSAEASPYESANWLAIDPKPLVGDRAFEIAPALCNRAEEMGTGSGFRWSVRRRVEVICEAAGIDEDRARAWAIVREAINAVDGASPERVSLAVSLIKAMGE